MNAYDRPAEAPHGHTLTARHALDAAPREAIDRSKPSRRIRRWLAPALLVAIVGGAVALFFGAAPLSAVAGSQLSPQQRRPA